jgi:hypothetical protein
LKRGKGERRRRRTETGDCAMEKRGKEGEMRRIKKVGGKERRVHPRNEKYGRRTSRKKK